MTEKRSLGGKPLVEAHSHVEERLAKGADPVLRLRVAGRPADRGEAPASVMPREVTDHIGDAARAVHGDAGDAPDTQTDRDLGQISPGGEQLLDSARLQERGDCGRDGHEAVDGPGVSKPIRDVGFLL